LETEQIVYLTYLEAVSLHFELMQIWGETRYGVFDRTLIESALARPEHAAVYESADLIRQAATLCYGLIKNHPWVGGNKRTAAALTEDFLNKNGWGIVARPDEFLELVLAVESDRWKVDEIESWLRERTNKIETK
jgi:death-on-curing protein